MFFTETFGVSTDPVSSIDFIATEDIQKTWGLPYAILKQSEALNRIVRKSHFDDQYRFSSLTAINKEKLNEKFEQNMKILPLFPCINCSRAVQSVSNLSVQYIEKKRSYPRNLIKKHAVLRPYKIWWKKTQPHTVSFEKGIKPLLRICKTSHSQLSSSSTQRWKRNLIKNDLAIPKERKQLTCLTSTERRLLSLVQPFARIYKSHLREGLV